MRTGDFTPLPEMVINWQKQQGCGFLTWKSVEAALPAPAPQPRCVIFIKLS
jgi:hypothetical protein